MEEKSTYTSTLVEYANDDIRKYGKEIQIVKNEDDDYYFINIITIDKERNVTDTETFAENLFENELADAVNDAWANVREKERIDCLHPDDKMAPKHLYPLLHTRSVCSDMLERALLEFVKKNGVELTDYEINEFGLDEGRDGEGTIIKVWNFFDNEGCFFALTDVNDEFDYHEEKNKVDIEGLEACEAVSDIDDVITDKLEDKFYFNAFQCLYIVVDDDGCEHLKYYRFSNEGTCFDQEYAEPEHDYVFRLSLVDLCYLVSAIQQNPEQP